MSSNTAGVTGSNNLILKSSALGNGTIGSGVILAGLADPRLNFSQLADNGGPTQTLAITTTSPAFRAGIPITGVTTDQRNAPRPPTAPSLGAFELAFALTTAGNNSVPFSADTQDITLTASSLYGSTPVTEGTVTFTIMDNKSNVIGTPLPASPDGTGISAVIFTLPPGLAPGVYSINVVYQDPNFSDDGDTSGTLTVGANPVTTVARTLTLGFSSSTQSAPLSASVTSGILPVTEGSVLFTVVDSTGHTIGSATAAPVKSVAGPPIANTALASYILPAGLTVGTYNIQVSYNDPTGDFVDVSDQPNTLTIVTTRVNTTANNTTANFNSAAQNVTLTAAVTGIGQTTGSVGEGLVTFSLKDGSAPSSARQRSARSRITPPAFRTPCPRDCRPGIIRSRFCTAIHRATSSAAAVKPVRSRFLSRPLPLLLPLPQEEVPQGAAAVAAPRSVVEPPRSRRRCSLRCGWTLSSRPWASSAAIKWFSRWRCRTTRRSWVPSLLPPSTNSSRYSSRTSYWMWLS